VLAERRTALSESIAKALPREGQIVFEIGSGHGHFLTAFAHAHPETLFVGVDNDSDRVARAQKKATRAKLTNLHFLRADAQLLVEVLPASVRLAAVYILFPDPWPKLRHHKHRVVQSKFLHELASRMAHGAALFFRTDFAPYFEDTKAKLAATGWSVSATESWPFERESVFQSRAVNFQSLVARPPQRP
jgi:tRNA (guanine-N7-)-methyltransferase